MAVHSMDVGALADEYAASRYLVGKHALLPAAAERDHFHVLCWRDRQNRHEHSYLPNYSI